MNLGSSVTAASPEKSGTSTILEPARIEFTGTGSEYFRIWFTNLLLTYLTLGIYSAWAKVRREKYFHQNTVIAGYSLDYHGRPMAILKGRALAFVLLAISSSTALPIVGYLALGIIALAFPFFMQRSLRFRFANSSYRGIRFGFNGSVKEAYVTVAPFLIPPLVYAGLVVFAFAAPERSKAIFDSFPKIGFLGSVVIALLLGAGYIAFMAMFQAVWRRYTINHAKFGFLGAATSITKMRYFTINLSSMAAFVAAIALLALAAYYILPNIRGEKGAWISPIVTAFAPFILFAFYFAFLGMQAVIAARIQNYCWHTNTEVRTPKGLRMALFNSKLSISSYAWLQIRNWIFIVLTLGLYRPYALIKSTKARLEAISINNSRFIDFVINAESQAPSAIGDEALDAFDIDFAI
jgi:uncharacterized membrane protein YjgN (DUF898 family)